MVATEPFSLEVNIGAGNGLVPSGNKPLPKPMLTQIYGVTGASLGQNELKSHLVFYIGFVVYCCIQYHVISACVTCIDKILLISR